jgi:hypothetical protein
MSTRDIVSNPRLVKNICQVDGYIQLVTQAGSTTTNWMADVPGYHRPVWFHPGGIVNILSMVNMIVKYGVTKASIETNSAFTKPMAASTNPSSPTRPILSRHGKDRKPNCHGNYYGRS